MFESSPVPQSDPRLHWHVISVPKGDGLRGWKAGPVVNVWCHHVGVSTPCWSRLTEGVILCPHCVARQGVRLIGYQPIYLRPSLAQRVVILSRSMLGVSATIPHAHPVRLTAPPTRGLPVMLSVDADVELSSSAGKAASSRPAVDIRPYLLHLWQVPELTRHFGEAL